MRLRHASLMRADIHELGESIMEDDLYVNSDRASRVWLTKKCTKYYFTLPVCQAIPDRRLHFSEEHYNCVQVLPQEREMSHVSIDDGLGTDT